MRPCSAALKAFLEGPAREAFQVDLYTVALVTGETFRWTAGNIAVTVPAVGFPATSINGGAARTFALGPGFGRSTVTVKLGVEASELDLQIYLSEALYGIYTLAELVRYGLFDGATVELDKLFSPATGIDPSLGVLVWFRGKVADAEIGRSVVRLKVKGVLDRLSTTQFPRRLYASSCSHVFGAPMCGYDRVAGTNALGEATGWGAVTIAALAGSTPNAIISSYVPAVTPSPYNEGTITALTGGNTAIARTIRFHDAGYVYPAQPFLTPIAAGDTFEILPGCSHSASMCEEVFNNLARYGGFLHVPVPEASI